MKKTNSLVVLLLIVSPVFHSQTTTKADVFSTIQTQNKSRLTSPYQEDSLNGFNEEDFKSLLRAERVLGSEYNNYISSLKRHYINTKYQLKSDPSPEINTKQKSVISASPCVNEGFEQTPAGTYTAANSVSGWSLSSMSMTLNSCSTGTWLPGASEFSIVSTPITNFLGVGTITQSPLGGSMVAVINSTVGNCTKTRISTSFLVSSSNNLFKYAYAGFFADAGHSCCYQAGFTVRVLDCNYNVIACNTNSYDPTCPTDTYSTSYLSSTYGRATNWKVKYVDLTPYVGSCVTVECWANDCAYGGHQGYMVFDADCGQTSSSNVANLIPVINASGNLGICTGQSSTVNVSGANSYSWNNGSTLTTQVFTPSVTTSYTILGSNTNNNCSGSSIITVTVGTCLGIESTMKNNSRLNVFPNPNSGIFNISVEQPAILIIYNSMGQIVLEKKLFVDTAQIDLSDFSNGIYFLHFVTNDGEKTSVKVLKQSD